MVKKAFRLDCLIEEALSCRDFHPIKCNPSARCFFVLFVIASSDNYQTSMSNFSSSFFISEIMHDMVV